MSISANTITSVDLTDGGIEARTQVIAASLDQLYRWNNGQGPPSIGTSLTGKLEIERPIGLMGHSRGGEGVTQFPAFNRARAGRHYDLGGVLALAPTDFNKQVPEGTNFAEALPTCDGDVLPLSGAHAYERSKRAPLGTPYDKLQWAVLGANHNWVNTVWTYDDTLDTYGGDSACDAKVPGNLRLDPGAQRTVGASLMAAFFRRYVGGETGFQPLMTGEAAPSGVGTSFVGHAPTRRARPIRSSCRPTSRGRHS